MRNAKLTRLLALLLAMMMAFALVACGADEEEQPAQDQEQTQTEEPKEEEKEEEKVVRDTFTMAISYMPDALSPIGNGSDDYTTMTRPLYDKLFMENNEGGID